MNRDCNELVNYRKYTALQKKLKVSEELGHENVSKNIRHVSRNLAVTSKISPKSIFDVLAYCESFAVHRENSVLNSIICKNFSRE